MISHLLDQDCRFFCLSFELVLILKKSILWFSYHHFDFRETSLFHAFVTPFTVKKNLRVLAPMSKAASLKPVVSGLPLKKINMNVGAPLDIDARVVAESDAKYTDLYSYLEKIRQHNPISLVHTAVLPSTIRRSSLSVVFNPQASLTKEVSVVLAVCKFFNIQISVTFHFKVD